MTRAVVIAGTVLLVFAVAGQVIFSSLGVTPAAFSIAGGVLLFLIAIDMLFGRQSGARETPKEARDARTREDISVFPLAIPLIAGPGALATVTLLVSTSQAAALPTGRCGCGHHDYSHRRLDRHAYQLTYTTAGRRHRHYCALARAGDAAGSCCGSVHSERH